MVRRFVRYWLPALCWLVIMFVASTDLLSAEHTSRFIGPFLQWLIPDIAPETIRSVQFAVRKAAHVVEYAVLAALLLRAIRGERTELRLPSAVLAVALAVAWAVLDEYHQSFVASRTGSPGDVLIDTAGAVLGATGYWWAVRRKLPKSV